jgi:hypothetical protein
MRRLLRATAMLVLAFGCTLVGLPAHALMLGVTTLTTDADMQAALKIIFDDAIVNSVVYDSELADYFTEGDGLQMDRTTGGRYIETANMFALPAGVGARVENGYVPVPNGPTIVNGRINLKKIMGSVEMSSETMKMVRTNIGAFLNWGERAMPSLVERVTNELDRMLLGYGAAIKARVNAASPAVALVVDSAYGIAGYTKALLQFLEGETIVASPNANGTSPRSGVMTVNSVDFDANVVNVNALASGLLDNDFLAAGDAADSSWGKESMGLLGMVDDGGILNLFQNINRTTYPRWRSYVLDVQTTFGSGQQLTEGVITRADDECFIRGGGKVDTLITSRAGLRTLWVDLRQDRQINDPRGYTGGKGPIRILLVDRYLNVRACRKMPDALCFGLQKNTFRKWVLHRWEWDDTTGALWKQVVDSTGRKDAFYAYGSMFHEYGCRDPQKNFRIENFEFVNSGT